MNCSPNLDLLMPAVGGWIYRLFGVLSTELCESEDIYESFVQKTTSRLAEVADVVAQPRPLLSFP